MAQSSLLPRVFMRIKGAKRRLIFAPRGVEPAAAFSTSSSRTAEDPYTAIKSFQTSPKARPPTETTTLPSFSPEERADASNPNLHGYVSTTTGNLTTSTATNDTTTPEWPLPSGQRTSLARAQGFAPNTSNASYPSSSRARPQTLPEILSNLQDQGRKKEFSPPSASQEPAQRRLTKPQRSAEREARARAEQARAEQTRSLEYLMLQRSAAWSIGNVYAPHDLSAAEHMKTRAARQPTSSRNRRQINTRRMRQPDVVDQLRIKPLLEYKNMTMMSEFMTDTGRIRGARDTGLRAVNQRKMAKAVRRAIGIGLLPSVHRHPELFPERLDQRGQYIDR